MSSIRMLKPGQVKFPRRVTIRRVKEFGQVKDELDRRRRSQVNPRRAGSLLALNILGEEDQNSQWVYWQYLDGANSMNSLFMSFDGVSSPYLFRVPPILHLLVLVVDSSEAMNLLTMVKTRILDLARGQVKATDSQVKS